MRNITLITTGGTIEKTYDEVSGQLLNRGSIVKRMLKRLRLEEQGQPDPHRAGPDGDRGGGPGGRGR